MNKIEMLKRKVVISVQAMPSEPLYDEVAMTALIKSVLKGKPAGLRVAGVRDVKIAKFLTDLPIIGITKPSVIPQNFKEIVYITPTANDVNMLSKAGADIIAFDGTTRKRPNGDNLKSLIQFIHLNKKIAMADISTFEEGLVASALGADILSTTLAGYTVESPLTSSEPDFKLLKKLTETTDCPIFLEGRIWTTEQVKRAFDLGAHAVVIGSAVTRPQLITKRFVEFEKDTK